MSNRASPRIFCVRDELVLWLRELATRYDLATVQFDRDGDGGKLLDALDLADTTYRLFLMPRGLEPEVEIDMNDVQSRPCGWLDAEPGGLVQRHDERRLRYSVVVGEDVEDEPVHPSRFVRWLKRRIQREATAGVVGRNRVLGGESRYRDLWHTEPARQLLADGVVWAQFLDGRAQFRPDDQEPPAV